MIMEANHSSRNEYDDFSVLVPYRAAGSEIER